MLRLLICCVGLKAFLFVSASGSARSSISTATRFGGKSEQELTDQLTDINALVVRSELNLAMSRRLQFTWFQPGNWIQNFANSVIQDRIAFIPEALFAAWNNQEFVSVVIELLGHLKDIITAQEGFTGTQLDRPWPLYRQMQCLYQDESVRDSVVSETAKHAIVGSKNRIVEMHRFAVYNSAAYHASSVITSSIPPTPGEYQSGVVNKLQEAWGTEGFQKLTVNAVSQPVDGETLLGHEVLWFVTTDAELQEVVLTIRGSGSIDDWLTNLDVVPLELNAAENFGTMFNKAQYPNSDMLSVHRGFFEAMMDIEGPALDAVAAAMTAATAGGGSDAADWRVVVTGYSLSAAVGTLMYAHWVGTDKILRATPHRANVYCYTYGTPGGFPHDALNLDPAKYIAVVYADDIVARVNSGQNAKNQVNAATAAIQAATNANPALRQACYQNPAPASCKEMWKTVQAAVSTLKTDANAAHPSKWGIAGAGVVYLPLTTPERTAQQCFSGQTRPTELEQNAAYVVDPIVFDEIYWTFDPVVLWFNPLHLATNDHDGPMLSLSFILCHTIANYIAKLRHAIN
eukprot:g13854.t1